MKNLIGVGKCEMGLYRMSMVASERKDMMTSLDIDMWHKRLGHTSDSKICQVDFMKGFLLKIGIIIVTLP